MRKITVIIAGISLLAGCGNAGRTGTGTESTAAAAESEATADIPAFDRDSAYSYVSRQVSFGPRVPNSDAHEKTVAWLKSELTRHGAEVTEQKADLTAWDGTILKSTNIMGSFNPDQEDRLLLLAHYDTRPWADQDPDPANQDKPIDGANDGASGVGVLLETARQLGLKNPGKGIDILFVDSEDYGTDGDEESWALGARYFAKHPIKPGYRASRAILLDMVGGRGAQFPSEYFSRQSAEWLDDRFRAAAVAAGHGALFPTAIGSAVTDDHLELIKQGIPAIDIIDYRTGEGFCPTWHTMQDNMDNIDRDILGAAGESLIRYIYQHD